MLALFKSGYRRGKGFADVPVEETAHLSSLAENFNKPTRVRVVSAARKIMAVAKRKGLIKHSPFSEVNFGEGFPAHRAKKRPASRMSL
ncbi:hypothetical protein [Bradyrhizobium sp. STM 3557]|uniref:hypothetical protein n=1 Tax=Bradyrhizobium sp. STM 3557 TaxID=578920 RepID=UPI00388DBF8E